MVPITLAKFDVSAIIIMVPIALATMMEHVGDIAAISATCNRNFLANPGLHRTLIGDGVATSIAGMLGGPANTTYSENTGVLALTKVYDPVIMEIAAVVAICFGFVPKFGEFIHTIPTATIGGVSFILYGMISAIGVRNVVENQVDFTGVAQCFDCGDYPDQRPWLQQHRRHYIPCGKCIHYAQRFGSRSDSWYPAQCDLPRKRL